MEKHGKNIQHLTDKKKRPYVDKKLGAKGAGARRESKRPGQLKNRMSAGDKLALSNNLKLSLSSISFLSRPFSCHQKKRKTKTALDQVSYIGATGYNGVSKIRPNWLVDTLAASDHTKILGSDAQDAVLH